MWLEFPSESTGDKDRHDSRQILKFKYLHYFQNDFLITLTLYSSL